MTGSFFIPIIVACDLWMPGKCGTPPTELPQEKTITDCLVVIEKMDRSLRSDFRMRIAEGICRAGGEPEKKL